MKMPWSKRADRQQSYSDVITDYIVQRAGGQNTVNAAATAALEIATGMIARSFQVSTIHGGGGVVTPSMAADMARLLLRNGEALYAIQVGPSGKLELIQSATWDVQGSYHAESWMYRVDLQGPSTTTTKHIPAGGVVHMRYATEPQRPWVGIGPLEFASLTNQLFGTISASLRDEHSGAVGYLLPVPEDPKSNLDENGNEIDPYGDLKATLAKLGGRTALVETLAQGHGAGSSERPDRDWIPARLGPNPSQTTGGLYQFVASEILAVCGIPPSLFGGVVQAESREAWRRFGAATLIPLGERMAEELRVKLEDPSIHFSFERIASADIASRARAVMNLASAGMDIVQATQVAGIEDKAALGGG